MKKILLIFLLIFLYSCCLVKKDQSVFFENVKFKFRSNEAGITFLSLDNNRSLLIQRGDIKILLILEYLDFTKIEEVLTQFNITQLDYVLKPDGVEIPTEAKKVEILGNNKIDSFFFAREANRIIITYLDYRFCVYDQGSVKQTIQDCSFLYFLNVDQVSDVSESTKIIFYDEGIKDTIMEKFYGKWVDQYGLREKEYVTLHF